MPTICSMAATPAVPCDALLGFAFSHTSRSFKSFAAMVLLATAGNGPSASSAIGLRSATQPAARQHRLQDAEIVYGGEVSWCSLQQCNGTITRGQRCAHR